ncbi:MAG: reprolysin-like metallopeptidase [Phycisphaerales bacterium JB040]
MSAFFRSTLFIGLNTFRARAESAALVSLAALAACSPAALGGEQPALRNASDQPVVMRMSSDGDWAILNRPPSVQQQSPAWVRPTGTPAFAELAPVLLRDRLDAAPSEFDNKPALVIEIPNPDGEFTEFAVVRSPVMHPDLQARYPEIQTYAGRAVDRTGETVRISMTPSGFAAQVLGPGGAWYVDRYSRYDNAMYSSYRRPDVRTNDEWSCLFTSPDAPEAPDAPQHARSSAQPSGDELRTFRVAIGCTGEYTAFHGGTVPGALAAVVTALNRVNGIYEREFAIRMELVPNNDQVIYTNAGSDPYSNTNAGAMLSQNQSALDSVIGFANYDIGHVFSTGGGGVAFLGAVCTGSKAGGVTGLPSPIGDPFYVDYVAHEMGHQFGANHTFNGLTGSCSGGNRNGSTAFEPGSASTIMGYAGICGTDDLQLNSDPYFHSISYDEINALVSNASCAVTTPTGNSIPNVSAGPSYTVPIGTPFELTASGSDADPGDVLTYLWEQRNAGPARPLEYTDNGSSPLFRSFEPTTSPTRTFPRLANVLANADTDDEHVPGTNRTMNFRVTITDNALGGGGVASDQTIVQATTDAGPFLVTSHNQPGSHAGTLEVTWDVARTDTGSVNTPLVDISLSTDGGQTYPHLLASGTPNDGSEFVAIPVASASARIKVKGSGNAFFDVNNSDIAVQPAGLAILLPGGAPATVQPGVFTTLEVEILPGTSTLVPGSATLHYRVNGSSFQTAPLTPLAGPEFEAALPPVACGDVLEYYLSAESVSGETVLSPSGGQAVPRRAVVGTPTVILSDNAQTNIGWTVSGTATDGQWNRGVPVGFGRADPPTDASGSGAAWLTDNSAAGSGNSDVDSGQTVLTSPTFDLSDGGEIEYRYWFNDTSLGPINGDQFRAEVSTNNGSSWTTVRTVTEPDHIWRRDVIRIGDEVPASPTVRIRFSVSDQGTQNIVEGGLDSVIVRVLECTDPACGPADVNGDGIVDNGDISAFINLFLANDPAADVNGDGIVDNGDIGTFIASFLAGC